MVGLIGPWLIFVVVEESKAQVPIRDRGRLGGSCAEYGRSVNGIPLMVWGDLKPGTCLLIGGVHGEEQNPTVTVSRALRAVPPEMRTANVVVCANPDGHLLGTRGNANGVDLNRNFPAADWSEATIFHRWDGRREREVALNAGAQAGSEPEVSALISLVQSLDPLAIVDVHSPLGKIIDLDSTPIGEELATRTGLHRTSPDSVSITGSAAHFFRELGKGYVNLELPDQSVFTSTEMAVPHLSALIRGEFTQ